MESEETFFQPIYGNKIGEPSKEMNAAIKVLNDSIKKPNFLNLSKTSLRHAIGIIQNEWFKISSLKVANPLIVEEYLDGFEEFSTNLLEFIVNLKDETGNTAMHYAISHGNFDVVSILLDSKVCDINVANNAGYTCIMLASLADITSRTHYDVIRRLFTMADVNRKAKQGQTTLMIAAAHGKVDVTKLLLECGADLNIQDDDGSSALMCAAEHNYYDIVNLLISHRDIDLNLKDNEGYTALAIAMEAGHRDISIALYTRQYFTNSNQTTSSSEKQLKSSSSFLDTISAPKSSVYSAPSSPPAKAYLLI